MQQEPATDLFPAIADLSRCDDYVARCRTAALRSSSSNSNLSSSAIAGEWTPVRSAGRLMRRSLDALESCRARHPGRALLDSGNATLEQQPVLGPSCETQVTRQTCGHRDFRSAGATTDARPRIHHGHDMMVDHRTLQITTQTPSALTQALLEGTLGLRNTKSTAAVVHASKPTRRGRRL